MINLTNVTNIYTTKTDYMKNTRPQNVTTESTDNQKVQTCTRKYQPNQ